MLSSPLDYKIPIECPKLPIPVKKLIFKLSIFVFFGVKNGMTA